MGTREPYKGTGKFVQKTKHNTRLKRILEILEALSDGEVLLVSELSTRLHAVDRTIRRDLVALREMGHRIDGSAGRGGGIRLVKPKLAAAE